MYGSEASERATSSHSQNSHFYSNNSRNFAHFESEINPEDLFNMFFGEQAGYSFGPRMRTRTYNSYSTGNRFRQQQHQHTNAAQGDQGGLMRQLSFMSESEANFSFKHTPKYNLKKYTSSHKVPYYVNQRDFVNSDISRSRTKLARFEKQVVNSYVSNLREQCEYQMQQKRERINQAQGFLGLFPDTDALNRARKIKLEYCDLLNSFT
ncbi:putative J domain-containing protein [Smittium culicis]|uniref:Putative J domain-containing protein n=1 Tax=Smittium culicis TaxID=133412 RepID=A0A1R1XQV4_9FUNG|nr:putative J domain-containing protein [Smittium culicis]OMJ17023.1 putative J domain-containing protein [Smittium culicis]